MSRPLRIPIDDGVNDWDALVNDNLIELFDAPLPIHASTSPGRRFRLRIT